METIAYGYGLVEAPRVDENGNLYFSDALGGGVYRRSPDGTIDHSNYSEACVLAHDVDADGAGTNRRVFARMPKGNPDGLAVDETGGVWVALGSGGGIARFSPQGHLLSILDVPSPFVTSLC